jgi:N-methylhydantoinase B
MENAIDYSREHMRKMLAEIPDGKGNAVDVLEDDGFSENKRFEIHVSLQKSKDKLVVDCAGTSKQAMGPINQSMASSKGSIYAALLSLIDPELALNEGIVDFVDIRLPEGSLVNPRYPAPVSSYFHIMTRVAENVVRAMEPMRPDLVVAGSYGDAQNISGWGFDPETDKEFIWYLFQCGGTGGRATRDGNTGIRHLLANARSESMEIWEKRYPLFFLAYEVVMNSAGPGKHRGGLGQRRVMRLEADTFITANTDRQIVPPVGVFGGSPGTLNNLTVVRDGKRQSFKDMFGFASPSKFSNARLRKGDILVCELGGGGGYGDALERDPKKIEWDVKNGWVSIEKAKADYGVSLDPVTGKTAADQTQKLRAQMRGRG